VQDTKVDIVPSSHAPPLRADLPSLPKPSAGTRIRHLVVGQRQANITSLLGAALCVVAGICLAAGAPIAVAAVLFPLGALCDLADGFIARAAAPAEPSKAGSFIDSICDKVGEAALIGGMAVALHDYLFAVLALFAYIAGSLTSYTKAVAGEHGLEIVWPEARVYGRAVRVALLSAALLLGVFLPNQVHLIFVLGLCVLLVFNGATFAWRLNRAARCLTSEGENQLTRRQGSLNPKVKG
jgi:phosphatidylglycerophosphate synthase